MWLPRGYFMAIIGSTWLLLGPHGAFWKVVTWPRSPHNSHLHPIISCIPVTATWWTRIPLNVTIIALRGFYGMALHEGVTVALTKLNVCKHLIAMFFCKRQPISLYVILKFLCVILTMTSWSICTCTPCYSYAKACEPSLRKYLGVMSGVRAMHVLAGSDTWLWQHIASTKQCVNECWCVHKIDVAEYFPDYIMTSWL